MSGWIDKNITETEFKTPGHTVIEGQRGIKVNPEAPAPPIGRMVATSTETENPLMEELC